MKLKYLPLEYRRLDIPEYERKALFFDPKAASEKVLNKFSRNIQLPIEAIFPKKETCSCGCGKDIGKGRGYFHNDECQYFAEFVRKVFTGDVKVIKYLLERYYGTLICAVCGEENKWGVDNMGALCSSLELDHIVPVCEGGGGCWLNNYQMLCHKCHVMKNKREYVFKPEYVWRKKKKQK